MKHSCVSCLIYYVKFNLVPSFSSVKSRTHWNPVYIILNGQPVKLTGISRVKSGGVSPLSDLCSAFRKVQIPKTLKRNETAIPIFRQVVNTTFTLQTVFLDKALSDFLLRFSFGPAEPLYLLTQFRLLMLNFSPEWRAADVRCIFLNISYWRYRTKRTHYN